MKTTFRHFRKSKYALLIGTITLLTFSLLLIACSSKAPHPTISKPGNELSANLTCPDLTNVAENTAPVYASIVDTEASIQRTAALLGVNQTDIQKKPSANDTEKYTTYSFPGGEFTLEEDTGYVMYNTNSSEMSAYDESFFPSDDRIREIVRDRLQTVLPDEAGTVNIEVSSSSGWDGSNNGVKYKTAHIHPTVDGKEVYGVYRIQISFDKDCNVVGLHLLYNPVELKTTVPLKDKTAVQTMLDKKDYSMDAAEELQNYALSSTELAFYMDADVNEDGNFFMYPVFVLHGQGTNSDGNAQRFDVIVDAVK